MKRDMKKRKHDLILIAAVLVTALVFALASRLLRGHGTQAGNALQVVAEAEGTEVLRVPLSENAAYIVQDGAVQKTDATVTLQSLGEEADPARHDVNLIVIEDGSVRCAEANCENQICVQTPALSADAGDTPIVCLPHGLFVYLTENGAD